MKFLSLLEDRITKLSTRLLNPKKQPRKHLNILANSVATMLTYREILHNPHLADVLDKQPFSESVKQDLFSQLSKANTYADNIVTIEGDMFAVTMSQWLGIQLDLTKALLLKQDTVLVSAPMLKSVFYVGYPTLPHALVDDELFGISIGSAVCNPVPFSVLGLGLVGVTASCISWYMGVGSPSQDCLAMLIGSSALSAQLLALDNITATSQFSKCFDELSTNWDDVFALKTRADAILMGWLYETICMLRAKGHYVPNFYALSPRDAAEALGNVVARSGHITDCGVRALNNVLANLKQAQSQDAPAMTLAGVDLTAFAAGTSTSTEHEALAECIEKEATVSISS